jgi:hypothetical protein
MAGDLPRAHLAHRIPHRLRVQVPSRKGDRAYFDRVTERLGKQPSIRSVRASPLAASITVEYEGHGWHAVLG